MLETNINLGEQPNDLEAQTVATENEGAVQESGSPLGKFKDSNSLLGAYNELQSEFTRKCQKLSEVQKKLDVIENSQSGNVSKDYDEYAWSNKLDDFLKEHQNANTLVEEITNEIINDDNLKNSEEALDKAYLRVMEKKFVSQENLSKDQEFLDKYIYSNDAIKNKIIKDYVDSLQTIKSPVTISTGGHYGSVAQSPKFNSLDDASRFVENMFKF